MLRVKFWGEQRSDGICVIDFGRISRLYGCELDFLVARPESVG